MDGINGPAVGEKPLEVMLAQEGVRTFSVRDEEASRAMRAAFEQLRIVVEPAGAASLAAVQAHRDRFRGKTVVVVASGGNADAAVFRDALN